MEAAAKAPKASQATTLRQLAVATRKHLESRDLTELRNSHAMVQAYTYLPLR